MDFYLLSRQIGSLATASNFRIEYTTRLLHTLSPAATTFAPRHRFGVTSISIDHQLSRYMLTAGADGSLSLWSLPPPLCPGESLAPMVSAPAEHNFGISSVEFYPCDRGLFVTSSYDKTVKVWDTEIMEAAYTFSLDVIVYAAVMAPGPSHALIATASQSEVVRLLDLKSGAATHSLIGHTGGTLGVNWCPRQQFLLGTGGMDGKVRIWDVRRADSCLAILDCENSGRGKRDAGNVAHGGPVNGVSWSEDGVYLVSLGHDEKMRVWSMVTGKNTLVNFGPLIRNRTQQVLNPVLTPLRLSDPSLVLTVSGSEILVFNLHEGTLIKRIESPDGGRINTLVQRPKYLEFYYGTASGKIKVFMPKTEDEGEEIEEDKNPNILKSIPLSLTKTPVTFS